MVEHLGKLRFWLLAVALSVSAVAVTAACSTKEVVRTVEVPVERVVEKEVVKEVEVPGETVVVEREVVKEVEVPGETVVVPITEIVFWYWADTPAQGVFFRKTIDEFNKTHPSIKVVGEVQPAALPAREKMATGALAGLGPDVTLIGLSFAQEFYRAGIIRGLDEFFDKWPGNVDIPEKLVEVDRAKTEDAPLIMLPVAYRVDFQFYRKDIYEAAGLKPAETVDEMFDTARALTVPPNQYGYGLRGADGWGFIYDVLNVLVAEGITLTDGKGGSDLDSPVAIETFEKIAKIYKDGITQPSAIQDRFPQMVAAFQTGKIAQWAASTVHWGMLRGEEGEFEHLIGVAPHAKGRAGQVCARNPCGVGDGVGDQAPRGSLGIHDLPDFARRRRRVFQDTSLRSRAKVSVGAPLLPGESSFKAELGPGAVPLPISVRSQELELDGARHSPHAVAAGSSGGANRRGDGEAAC